MATLEIFYMAVQNISFESLSLRDYKRLICVNKTVHEIIEKKRDLCLFIHKMRSVRKFIKDIARVNMCVRRGCKTIPFTVSIIGTIYGIIHGPTRVDDRKKNCCCNVSCFKRSITEKFSYTLSRIPSEHRRPGPFIENYGQVYLVLV